MQAPADDPRLLFRRAIRWSSTRDLRALPDEIYEEHYRLFIADPARQVITSAAYDQRALDVLDGETIGLRAAEPGAIHSPFAEALVAGLKGDADLVPAQGDGLITASELQLYLRYRIERERGCPSGRHR